MARCKHFTCMVIQVREQNIVTSRDRTRGIYRREADLNTTGAYVLACDDCGMSRRINGPADLPKWARDVLAQYESEQSNKS